MVAEERPAASARKSWSKCDDDDDDIDWSQVDVGEPEDE